MRECEKIWRVCCKPEGYGGQVGGLLLVDHDGDRFIPGYDPRGNVVTLVSESTGAMVAGIDEARQRGEGRSECGARRESDSGCPPGGIVKQYDPYGKIIRMEGATDKIPFRYQTKWDLDYGSESTSMFSFGLMDYGLRFYQAKHGRFINRDPIGEAGGLNLYEAFGGDPVNRWDLLGLDLYGRDEDKGYYRGRFPFPPHPDDYFKRPGYGYDSNFEKEDYWKDYWRRAVFISADSNSREVDSKDVLILPPFHVIAEGTSFRNFWSSSSGGTRMSSLDFFGFSGVFAGAGSGGSIQFGDGWSLGFREEGGSVFFGDPELLASEVPQTRKPISNSRQPQGPTISQMERMMNPGSFYNRVNPLIVRDIHARIPDDPATIVAVYVSTALLGGLFGSEALTGVVLTEAQKWWIKHGAWIAFESISEFYLPENQHTLPPDPPPYRVDE